MEKKRKILIDCDPGIDDALGIFLAAACKDKLEILGITTVAGNQTLERVTGNALRLVHFLKEDIPVGKGAAAPMVREPLTAKEIHGRSGLGNCKLPLPYGKEAKENAVLFLREKIMNLPAGEQVTLVLTGPLTNIALLFLVFPEVKERVEELVLMGGAVSGGNITASAEFNIYEDPEAAQVVYSSGLPIVMCGLDVTRQCGLTRNQVDKMSKSKNRVCELCAEMLDFYLDSDAYKGGSMASIHDAVTIMYLVHPELFEGEKMAVTVDCSQGLNRGMTVCDSRVWHYDSQGNITVLVEAEAKEFQRILIEKLFALGERLYPEGE